MWRRISGVFLGTGLAACTMTLPKAEPLGSERLQLSETSSVDLDYSYQVASLQGVYFLVDAESQGKVDGQTIHAEIDTTMFRVVEGDSKWTIDLARDELPHRIKLQPEGRGVASVTLRARKSTGAVLAEETISFVVEGDEIFPCAAAPEPCELQRVPNPQFEAEWINM